MIETPGFGKQFNSAESSHEMDAIEVRAVVFAHDPIDYLQNYIDSFADQQSEEGIPFEVISEIEGLAEIMTIDRIHTDHKALHTFVQHNPAYEGRKALFEITKELGISYDQLLAWIRATDETDTPQELLEQRGDLVALNEVYKNDGAE